jgi:hypothetical protein
MILSIVKMGIMTISITPLNTTIFSKQKLNMTISSIAILYTLHIMALRTMMLTIKQPAMIPFNIMTLGLTALSTIILSKSNPV